MNMRYRSLPSSVKANFDKRIIEGEANHADVKDSHGDVIKPATFSEGLNDAKHAARIRHLWQHRSWEPIGIPRIKDEPTLPFVSKIARIPRGDEALILAAEGVVKDISIGFNVLDEGPGKHNGEDVNIITKGILWELSSVTWGSNAESVVTDVRSFLGLPTPAEERAEGLTLSALVAARYRPEAGAEEQRALDVLIKAQLAREPLDADALKAARPMIERAINRAPMPQDATEKAAAPDAFTVPLAAWDALRELRGAIAEPLTKDGAEALLERLAAPVTFVAT